MTRILTKETKIQMEDFVRSVNFQAGWSAAYCKWNVHKTA